jgi:hypothetical protein
MVGVDHVEIAALDEADPRDPWVPGSLLLIWMGHEWILRLTTLALIHG